MPVPTDPQHFSVITSPISTHPFPLLTEQHILNCAFSSWYSNFRQVTLKSKIIKPLPAEFIEYLHADGVFLPDQNYGRNRYAEYSDDSDSDENNESEVEFNDENYEPLPNFPDLEQQIWQIIEEFDGAVFPKLNWSSPRDATWISATNTLKCTTPSDIFLLLKSSDFIAHDLDHAFDECDHDGQVTTRRQRPDSYELVLRKWYDVTTSLEFRCFVKNENIIAISQRDDNFYHFLLDIGEDLEAKIIQFFTSHIQNKFLDSDYVFDVYIMRNRERVWLIDFNPFGSMTDSLLFTWDEILTANQSHHQPFATNRYPREVFDFSQGQTVTEFAERFQRELAITEEDSE
ncbi:461_t:CDS:2 [Diversispora eburnea]|uniref:461_t:CDS:1 n=1 Tax=Diversispora eburnea TaxID=1213867 RepID=A0A9N9FN31_9GLOM|nr:461_t:CDS:2 [Diversispora eburnea]